MDADAATGVAAVPRPRSRAQKPLMRPASKGLEHSAVPNWKSEGPGTACRQGFTHRVLQKLPGYANSVRASGDAARWHAEPRPRHAESLQDGDSLIGNASMEGCTLHEGVDRQFTQQHRLAILRRVMVSDATRKFPPCSVFQRTGAAGVEWSELLASTCCSCLILRSLRQSAGAWKLPLQSPLPAACAASSPLTYSVPYCLHPGRSCLILHTRTRPGQHPQPPLQIQADTSMPGSICARRE